MSSVYYRIDDRLIHGQVVTGWARYYQLKQIIIVDEQVASDPIQQQIISLVAPSDIKVSIKSVSEGKKLIGEAEEKGVSSLVLVKGPESLLGLIEEGTTINEVIVGGMQFRKGKQTINKTVSVTEEESKYFKALSNANTILTYQVIPTDKKQSFSELLGTHSGREV